LESLEARYCPSGGGKGGGEVGPTLINVAAVALSNNMIQITGQVSDPDPSTVELTFSGVASGGTMPNSNGVFTACFNAAALGNETVNAVDSQNLSAAPVTVNVYDSGPGISGFTAVNSIGNWWTFSGTVIGTTAPGATLVLTGLPDLNNVSVTVSSNGTFSYTVQLAASDNGFVVAQATDCWNMPGTPQAVSVD
jgi:hypothetical protein